jgi:tRNA(Ile)-lysidine synthase
MAGHADYEERVGALPLGVDRASLVAAVQAALDRCLPRGAGTVMAVSGGPDSTALAYLVTEARPDLVTCVAHVRHGLRDDAADAATAAAHAAALGIDYHERAVRVEVSGEGVEAAARRARYEALFRVVRKVGAQALLVGHTADDQAETVLMNIARGSGLRGLAGMSAARGAEPDAPPGGVPVVRPLLAIRRTDVAAFVAGEGLRAVRDPTNRDPGQRRARARHDALPALAALSGGTGDPVGALTRLADLARADADALDALAAEQARRLVVPWGPVRAVPMSALLRLPRALSGRIVRLMLRRVRGGSEGLSAAAVARVLALRPGAAVHVHGGVWVTAGGDWLAAAPAGGGGPLARRTVAVPGITVLRELGLELHADVPEKPQPTLGSAVGPAPVKAARPAGRLAAAPPGAGGPVWTVAPVSPSGLSVRSRRPGDRLRLVAGSRKVQDLFVDAGVPRAVREVVPIVVDADDVVVWVPGVAVRHDPQTRDLTRLWLSPAARRGAERAQG